MIKDGQRRKKTTMAAVVKLGGSPRIVGVVAIDKSIIGAIQILVVGHAFANALYGASTTAHDFFDRRCFGLVLAR